MRNVLYSYPNFKLTLVILRIHEEKEIMTMVRDELVYLTQNPVDSEKNLVPLVQ
jgi:hypothetical protein